MKIDRALNLAITIEREGAPAVHVHATPISRAVFEANYALISRVDAEMYARGQSYYLRSGPRVAALTLRDVGRQEAADHGREGDGGAGALLAEIRRLTNVIEASENGWHTLPLDTALQRNLLDADEAAEVENAVVFFSAVCATARRSMRDRLLTAMASLLGAQTVSSNATEFAGSLPKLTPAEHTHKHPVSSVPV